ncbi:MAG TPA: M48 family metalloprotease, partial [Leptospiraceae bacterium]|nr:M48 family metalloprotease [Leptospiraceae bacterium]
VVMPFTRSQESQADLVGLDLMAKAGFNPGQSILLWKNMSALGGKKQPAFLSDHPSNENRIKDLQGAMPKAMQQMAAANAQGRTPNCR